MTTYKSKLFAALTAVVSFAILATPAFAQGRKAVKSATGPFSYSPSQLGEVTFLGNSGSPTEFDFDITAPSGGTIFPAGSTSAAATIRVFGIEKVADADGMALLDPEDLDLASGLGMWINDAIIVDPAFATFTPGWVEQVRVYIDNPEIDAASYGHYIVTIKAQSPGSGIGVGSGVRVLLKLLESTETDTVPPDVTIVSPSGDEILGQIAVEISAKDPAPGTGVASMSASVTSAGGAVTDLAIVLASDAPKPADVVATATGTFVPTGGTGANGTIEASAFTAASSSGNGSYTLTANAVDGASNEGSATTTFKVTYNVEFTQADGQINNGQPQNSVGRIKFTAERSSSTSDGAFMYDKTVVVELVRVSDDAVVSTHVYGAGGGVQNEVLIEADPVYHTNFRRGSIGATSADTYKARVSFLDVDGNVMQMGESANLTF